MKVTERVDSVLRRWSKVSGSYSYSLAKVYRLSRTLFGYNKEISFLLSEVTDIQCEMRARISKLKNKVSVMENKITLTKENIISSIDSNRFGVSLEMIHFIREFENEFKSVLREFEEYKDTYDLVCNLYSAISNEYSYVSSLLTVNQEVCHI